MPAQRKKPRLVTLAVEARALARNGAPQAIGRVQQGHLGWNWVKTGIEDEELISKMAPTLRFRVTAEGISLL